MKESSDQSRINWDRPMSRLARRCRTMGQRIALASCLGVALAEAIAVGCCYAHERISLHVHSGDSSLQRDPTDGRFAFFAAGIDRPPARAARDARLADDEPVLGVQVGTRFRAYRVVAMRDPSRHIVNDVIDDVGVTVTYCDINDFAAGFIGGQAGEPLAISQGGVFNGGMVVCVGGSEYAQQTREPSSRGVPTAAFPYRTHPLVRTTWKLWRDRHQETDVYEGDLAIEGSAVSDGNPD